MIRHIVLLELKAQMMEKEISEFFSIIGKLREKIPQIQNFFWGKCESPEKLNKQFTYGFTMDFLTAEDRDSYLVHEAHQDVVNKNILPALADGLNSALVFDFQM